MIQVPVPLSNNTKGLALLHRVESLQTVLKLYSYSSVPLHLTFWSYSVLMIFSLTF